MSTAAVSEIFHLIPDFVRQMCAYREFLKQSVLRDLRTKYKRSVLGYLWTMIHPLAMMAVLAVVFSHIMHSTVDNYAVFLFTGLLPWNYFNSTVMMSLGSIRNNSRLFGQIALPKYLFILSLTFSNLANFFFAIVPLLCIMLATGRTIPMTALALPALLVPLFFVTVGLSLILAACNVFFDDTLHLAEVGMSMLYFLSPILYHRELLPPWLVQYLVLNPLFCQIEFIRGIFYEGRLPDPELFLINFAASTLILFIGLFIFKRSEDKFLYFV